MTSLRAAVDTILAALVGVVVTGGCALEQKMSLEVIDAPLRARGIELKGSAGPGEGLHLGPYEVTQVERQRSQRGTELLPRALPRPASYHQLRFDVVAPEQRRWHAQCEAQRRQARNPDLAGELDESHDEVALLCRFEGPDHDHWVLRLSGNIGRGLSGELRAASETSKSSEAAAGDAAAPASAGEAVAPGEAGALAFEAEVIVRRSFVRVVDRELPIAVVQLRRKKMAAAAMLLAAPERAWLAPGLAGPDRELAVVAMAALRLLPVAHSEL